MKEEITVKPFNAEEAVLNILPKAGQPEAGFLALRFKTEEEVSAMAKSAEEIRRDILLPEGIDGDYIIAKVLLNEISLRAAQIRVEILLSARAAAASSVHANAHLPKPTRTGRLRSGWAPRTRAIGRAWEMT